MKTAFLVFFLLAVGLGSQSRASSAGVDEGRSGGPMLLENLEIAIEEEKSKGDPTRDMFENIRTKKQGQPVPKN